MFLHFLPQNTKKIFLIPILRSLAYATLFFCLINYQNVIRRILTLIGWYSFFATLLTFIITLVWYLLISYYYFRELKSVATDSQMAEIYADHNSTTYNAIFFHALDRLCNRHTSPLDDFTILEDLMFTSWILHIKIGIVFNAWLLRNPYLAHKLSMVCKILSISHGKLSRFLTVVVSIFQKLNSYLDLISSSKYCITCNIFPAQFNKWLTYLNLSIVFVSI